MIEFLTINKILVSAISLFAVWIGFTVYRNNPKKTTNRILLTMTALMLFWVDFAYLARMVGDERINLSVLFLRIAWFVTPLFFMFLYFLVVYIIEKQVKYKLLNKICLFSTLIISAATGFTNLVIKEVAVVQTDLTIIYGIGMIPFMGVVLLLMISTLYVPIKEYKKISREQRSRIQYFLVGISVFYLANMIFNISFPVFLRITRLYWLGDYSSIFLLSFLAYAIVKEKLFGIKVILTQTLIGAIGLLLLVNFITAQTTFDFIWKGGLFLAFLIFAFLLIKSVQREIKQKERLDRYATELSLVNIKLERAYKKLQKLDKAKSEFISIASHQLRTPLTAIKGYISMILEGDYGKISKPVNKSLSNVFQSNERLIKLVNSLLNLSRLEAGKIKIEKKKMSPEKMIANIIKELSNNAKKRNLKLTFHKPKEKIIITADEQKIRQVVANLIDNSIKYTQKGGISVSLRKEKHNALIVVSDTGEGMTQDDIGKLFQTFSRAGAGNKLFVEGTGLGLYIAKKFINMHAGKIWAESEGKGKGSSFHIELPI